MEAGLRQMVRQAVDRTAYVLDRSGWFERMATLTGRISVLMSSLYGPGRALERAKQFVAGQLVFLVTTLVASLLLYAIDGAVWLQVGGCALIFIPLYAYKRLEQRVRKRKNAMLLELPELINRIVLLVNAGETVQQAILRIARSKAGTGPLAEEVQRLANELADQKSFTVALEDFSGRCSLQEVSMFTTAILLNQRKGGGEFVLALQDMSRTVWERRKALAKTLGEEASAKLSIPMLVLFCIVMVIVAAPAMMLMG